MAKQAKTERIGRVTLLKRGDWWHGRWTDAFGRHFRGLKVTFKEEAIQIAADINRQVERGEPVVLRRTAQKAPQFSVLIQEFRAKYKGWSPATFKAHAGMIAKLNSEFGHTPINRITTEQLETYRAQRMEKDGSTPATMNRYVSFLRRLFGEAVKWGYLAQSPAAAVKTLKEEQRVPEALTEDQANALIGEMPPHARHAVALALDTGLRRSELFRLAWRDIDWKRNQLTVRRSKTGKFRTIPLTQRAVQALKAQREQGKDRDLVFGFVDLKKSLASAGRRIGVEGLHIHMLRHTFATRLRDRGASIDRIGALLGHASYEMTLRYAQLRPRQLEDAISLLDEEGLDR